MPGKYAFLHTHGNWEKCTDDCGVYEVRKRREPGDPDGIVVEEVLVCDTHWVVHHSGSPDLRPDSKKPWGVPFPTHEDGTYAEETFCYESCRSHLVPTTMEMRYCETQAYKEEMEDA